MSDEPTEIFADDAEIQVPEKVTVYRLRPRAEKEVFTGGVWFIPKRVTLNEKEQIVGVAEISDLELVKQFRNHPRFLVFEGGTDA